MDHDRDCEISGHKLVFSSFDGVVEDVQHWTETQVWSEGGGHVPSRYGGYAQAAVVRSRSRHHLRARILWSDGRRASDDLPGRVALSPGDPVGLLAAENSTTKIWQWAGVVNFMTGVHYPVGSASSVAPLRPRTILDYVGLLAVAMDATVLVGLSALAAGVTGFVLWSLLDSVTPNSSSPFSIILLAFASYIVLAFVSTVEWTKRRKTGEAAYAMETTKIMRTMMDGRSHKVGSPVATAAESAITAVG